MSMKKWKHLQIPFEEIEIATKNFQTCIGKGGYGSVYKGELSVFGKLTTVAIKRSDEHLGQGLKEFLTEIQLLYGQEHPNLISLLGYCNEGKEKIIVYEYAERGSLDKYIRYTSTSASASTSTSTDHTLTWLQRLKICADAARGLDHLHSHVGEHQTIIHRDIKSGNILLDDKWVAKIADLGLSRLSLAGLDRSVVITHPCGTHGYCDPKYFTSGIVTTKSDVYSFGMVLFEVLCGRLCLVRDKDGVLLSADVAKEHYENKKMDDIIHPVLREQMIPNSLQKFSEIAYRCLDEDRERRPLMDVVTKELEGALKIQKGYEFGKERRLELSSVSVSVSDTNEYWEGKVPRDVDEIIKMFKIPYAIYSDKKELFSFLRKGILYDMKFFWINEDGKKCESISAMKFIDVKNDTFLKLVSCSDSRFSLAVEYSCFLVNKFKIKCEIKTSMLSIGTMYEASLVFKDSKKTSKNTERFKLCRVKWETEETWIHSSHSAELTSEELTSDNWYKIRMWHFINHEPNTDFNIVLEDFYCKDSSISSMDGLLIQGVEFHPIEMHEDIDSPLIDEEDIDDEEDRDSDDEYWEKKLPDYYPRYIDMSDEPLDYTTKKELYRCLCKGFHGDNGQLWISLCKSTGGILSRLAATDNVPDIDSYNRLIRIVSLSESRFGEVIQVDEIKYCNFKYSLRSSMFSPECIYACYLVFKFKDNLRQPDHTYLFMTEYMLDDISQGTPCAYLNLSSVNIPTLKPKNDYGSHNSSNIPRNGLRELKDYAGLGYGWIEERKDGWMEAMLCKNLQNLEDHMSLDITLSKIKNVKFSGMIIEGIEFRPCI